jgi:hypothetical protein
VAGKILSVEENAEETKYTLITRKQNLEKYSQHKGRK